jgi:hypothetical protein
LPAARLLPLLLLPLLLLLLLPLLLLLQEAPEPQVSPAMCCD